MSWFSGWSETVNRRICRFLIHRYLGHLLKEKLSLEQLSVDLYNGTGTIQDVNVDTQYVNEILDSLHVPISLVDGYMGEITASVPWADMLKDSCMMEVKRLEVTLRPHQPLNQLQPDTVSSMLESMMGSIASSMDLAKSFLNEDSPVGTQNERETPSLADEGIESFAQVIDAVLSRMRLVFVDTIVRIEYFQPNSDSGTAVEVRIERLDFLDEQLEACQQAGTSAEPITTQPHSLYTIPDLNKIIHLHGVRFYTDIFSKPQQSHISTDLGISQICTSMYMRRQQGSRQKTPKLDELVEQAVDFQSCYSNMSTGRNTIPVDSQSVYSDPVQFAQLEGEKQTIRLKLRNNQLSPMPEGNNTKIDIQSYLGGLSAFLTPAKLNIVQNIFGTLLVPVNSNGDKAPSGGGYGKPMMTNDFAQVETQLQSELNPDILWRTTDFTSGNWSGEEKFYETSRKPKRNIDPSTTDAFTSIVMNSDPTSASTDLLMSVTQPQRSPNPDQHKWNDKPEVTHIKARLSSFWLCLTHSDPLRESSVDLSAAITKMQGWAEKFFEKSCTIGLSARSDLNKMRPLCDDAFDQDHLRFISCPLVFDYTLERGISSSNVILQVSAANCQCLEYLCPDSNDTGKVSHIELLEFEKQPETWAEEPDLKFSLSNRDSNNHYQLSVELASCRTEFDVTLIDRIYNLSNRTSVCSTENNSNSTSLHKPYLFDTQPQMESLELRNDLFEPTISTSGGLNVNNVDPPLTSVKPSIFEIDFRCPAWTIDMRIPVADLRDPSTASGRPPWWVRRVQPETIRFEANNVRIRLPNVDSEKIGVQGSIRITCRNITGTMLNLESGHQKFLYANSIEKNKPCSFNFKWDMHNKSLRMDQENSGEGEQSPGTWASYFKISGSSLDGPFSKKVTVYENEELTLVGDKQEMDEFSASCKVNTDVMMEIDAPELKLCLPDKAFYELLYNRLINDFALWEPCSPAFHPVTVSNDQSALGSATSAYYSIHVAGLDNSAPQFQLCQSVAAHKDSDDDSESESASTVTDRPTMSKSAVNRRKSCASNRLCLSLKCGKGRVLLGTNVPETSNVADFSLETKKAELFVVSGYESDPNLVYFYVTLEQCWLWHQNVTSPDVVRWSNDVTNLNFAKPTGRASKWVQAEPTGQSQSFGELIKEDNFAVALKLELNPKENIKDILVAIGLRNSILHIRPFYSANEMWINQIVNFFDVVDYPIAGYELPRVVTELHVHAWNSQIAYDHAFINKEFPVQLRLSLDSCDVSSRIVQDFSVLRLRCLFEDSRLMAHIGNEHNIKQVTFDDDSIRPVDKHLGNDDFVCLMKMGFFDLEVTVNEQMMAANEAEARKPIGPLRGPLLELRARNDLLRLTLCADSLALLLRVAKELVMSDYFKTEQPSRTEDCEQKEKQEKVQLTPAMQEHLQEMVRSAIQQTVTEPATKQTKPEPESTVRQEPDMESALAAEIDSTYNNEETKSRSSTEEDFCIVDQIPGSGIVSPSGEPRIRSLSEIPVNINENHFSTGSIHQKNLFNNLPEGYPHPLIRYHLRNMSILLQFYGGNDFGDYVDPKPYSSASVKKPTYHNHNNNIDAKGGKFRDQSVMVECQLSKICFLYELFGVDAPAVSRQWLTVHDVEVRDRITLSKINKILYQYASGDRPRRTCAPMISIRQLETNPSEAKLKISLLPLRLNLDQDTLEFLQDFFAELNNFTEIGTSDNINVSDPVLEVQPPENPPEPENFSQNTATVQMDDSVATLKNFFQDEIENEVSLDGLLNSSEISVRFSKTSSKSLIDSETENLIIGPLEPADQLQAVLERQTGDQMFIKTFEFSPGVSIRLDYEGKQRVNMDQGAVHGLLLGLSQLHCTELYLKQLRHRQGLLGYGRCAQFGLNEWLVDIRRNQIPKVVGSIGPFSSLVEIAQGIRDLFVLPVEEYRKTDGHVVKGIQRGAESFGISTASATIELTQRVVGLVQGMAEFAFDIVTPEYPPPRRHCHALQLIRQPTDFREGLTMAYDTVLTGVNETAEVLQLAAQEERAQGRWPVRGILRQATPTALRPIVLASKATSHVLDGLKSQLKPDARKEQMDKWRQYK